MFEMIPQWAQNQASQNELQNPSVAGPSQGGGINLASILGGLGASNSGMTGALGGAMFPGFSGRMGPMAGPMAGLMSGGAQDPAQQLIGGVNPTGFNSHQISIQPFNPNPAPINPHSPDNTASDIMQGIMTAAQIAALFA